MTGSSERPLRTMELLLGVAIFAAAVFGACSKGERPVRFPHRTHLAGLRCGGDNQPNCLNCTSCHATASGHPTEEPAGAPLCDDCHRQQPELVQTVLSLKPVRPYGQISFNHDVHLRLPGVEGQCVGCHAGVVDASMTSMPAMSQCFSCHEHEQQWQKGQCTPCHRQADLKGILPETFLRHEGNFMRQHGLLATQQTELCQACHTQAQCDDCHDITQGLKVERRQPERVLRQFVHRGDFMTRHAIDARSEPARCATCHTPQSCDGCHTARGLSASLLNPLNPHPPGWVGANAGIRSQHAIEARRDIFSCASCHDQGPSTNCIRCHKVGAFGGNPHPPGFEGALNRGERMCRYCHE